MGNIPILDLHCDTADRLAWHTLPAACRETMGTDYYGPEDEQDPQGCLELGTNHCHISLDNLEGMAWAQCFACFVPDEYSPEQAITFHEHVFRYLEEQVNANRDRMQLATSSKEIRPLLEGGRSVAVHTIENARLFAADPQLVGELARKGLLMASLSWNAEGPLASGMDAPNAGITPLGAEVLGLMERNHVILDVSHLNDRSFEDVLRLSRRPFIASHSNSRAVCNHPRNLTDAQFVEIRDRGGVIGLNYCVDFLREDFETHTPDVDDLCRHIEHWLDLGGEDVVALGSDFDGTDVPDCLSTAAKMPAIQQVYIERFGEEVTRKLCYLNALNFFERCGR